MENLTKLYRKITFCDRSGFPSSMSFYCRDVLSTIGETVGVASWISQTKILCDFIGRLGDFIFANYLYRTFSILEV